MVKTSRVAPTMIQSLYDVTFSLVLTSTVLLHLEAFTFHHSMCFSYYEIQGNFKIGRRGSPCYLVPFIRNKWKIKLLQ